MTWGAVEEEERKYEGGNKARKAVVKAGGELENCGEDVLAVDE